MVFEDMLELDDILVVKAFVNFDFRNELLALPGFGEGGFGDYLSR